MPTIHEAMQSGRVTQLGPVTVKKLWPYKDGDKSINGVFTDATGEVAFKIWGATPSNGIYEGCVLTLVGSGPKGGIVNKEYPQGSGKWALNASECRVSVNGGQPATGQPAAAPAAYSAPATTQPAQAASMPAADLDNLIQKVADQAAKMTAAYVNSLTNHGISREEAIMLAQGAHDVFPLWWFGQKGV